MELSPTRSVIYVDTALREPTIARWSLTGPTLAVCSASGSVVLFRRDTRKKVPILHKEPSAITSGAWSVDGRLALASSSGHLSLSNADGDEIDRVELSGAPMCAQFTTRAPTDSTIVGLNQGGALSAPTVSVIVAGKALLLFTPNHDSRPVELGFQSKYGSIVSTSWFGNGYVAVGFSEGYLVIVSLAAREVTEEIFASPRLFKEQLSALAVSTTSALAAVAGGNTIRFINTRAWREAKELVAVVDAAHGAISSLAWTSDGQILTASTKGGFVYSFLARLPALAAAGGLRAALLTSLSEVSVCYLDEVTRSIGDAGLIGDDGAPRCPQNSVTVQVPFEPTILAVSATHVAAGTGSTLCFFRALSGDGAPPPVAVHERTYPALIGAACLMSTSAVVLAGGTLFVHDFDGETTSEGFVLLSGAGSVTTSAEGVRTGGPSVTAFAAAGPRAANRLLFFGTSAGVVYVYSLSDHAILQGVEMRLADSARGGVVPAIRSIAVNAVGTRAIVTDAGGRTFVFSPVDSRYMPVDAPMHARTMWDINDSNIFVCAPGTDTDAAEDSATSLSPFVYTPVTLTLTPTVAPVQMIESVDENGCCVLRPAQDSATTLPLGARALALVDGIVFAFVTGAGFLAVSLKTHVTLHAASAASRALLPGRAPALFCEAFALGHLARAVEEAQKLNDTTLWRAIAAKAMETLDVSSRADGGAFEFGDYLLNPPPPPPPLPSIPSHSPQLDVALRAYREVRDVAMVEAIRNIALGSEDRAAVAGHVAALFSDWDLAQDLLLGSSQPRAALTIRKDLLQWDSARALAARVAPASVPLVEFEIAKATELDGDARAALKAFKDVADALAATTSAVSSPTSSAVRALAAARAGIARCTIRLGDVKAGAAVATEAFAVHGDARVLLECAAIAEGLRANGEAAALYSRAGSADAAVRLYLAESNTSSAAPLMSRVVSPKLHAAFAHAAENAGDFAGAAAAYERARDFDALVRLLVERLGQTPAAETIVRRTRSRDAAAILAKAATARGDVPSAIEFLILARLRDEAFALAAKHGKMDVYVSTLRTGLGGAPSAPLPPRERERVGRFFESRGEVLAAAAILGGARALDVLLTCAAAGGAVEAGGPPDDARERACIKEATALVGAAKSEPLTARLLTFLQTVGPSGAPLRSPRYVLELHLALGAHAAAARTALIIARAEMDSPEGSPTSARTLLFDTYSTLSATGARVPQELARTLMLLHSYVLIKKRISAGDGEGAARLLCRISRNISRFAGQAANILQSAVVQCQRVGLKKQAHEFACMLLSGDFVIRDDYKKKIENIVRKPPTEPDNVDADSPCPFCDAPVAAYDLSCGACASQLPFCIVTGKHMTAAECTRCLSCNFPALLPALTTAAREADATCPLCSAPLALAAVALVLEPMPFLRKVISGASD